MDELKTYIRVPVRRPPSLTNRLCRAFLGGILAPVYWLLAHRYQVPGLEFRIDCAHLALRSLFAGKRSISYGNIYELLCCPIDSVRYFELAFMLHALSAGPIRRYLDVSSPRLLPALLMTRRKDFFADLINPDVEDLRLTANLIRAVGLESRCSLHDGLISSLAFEPESFDVITSMSVVEHIPQETAAIERMWQLLGSDGRLLLSVPCAAKAMEEYQDCDAYGLLNCGEDGFFFFQRYYDDQLLQERIFPITGRPHRYAVYGEVRPGLYRRNEERKMSDPHYPAWRVPYMMGKEYRYYDALKDLPGIGVIAMEFRKSTEN